MTAITAHLVLCALTQMPLGNLQNPEIKADMQTTLPEINGNKCSVWHALFVRHSDNTVIGVWLDRWGFTLFLWSLKVGYSVLKTDLTPGQTAQTRGLRELVQFQCYKGRHNAQEWGGLDCTYLQEWEMTYKVKIIQRPNHTNSRIDVSCLGECVVGCRSHQPVVTRALCQLLDCRLLPSSGASGKHENDFKVKSQPFTIISFKSEEWWAVAVSQM